MSDKGKDAKGNKTVPMFVPGDLANYVAKLMWNRMSSFRFPAHLTFDFEID